MKNMPNRFSTHVEVWRKCQFSGVSEIIMCWQLSFHENNNNYWWCHHLYLSNFKDDLICSRKTSCLVYVNNCRISVNQHRENRFAIHISVFHSINKNRCFKTTTSHPVCPAKSTAQPSRERETRSNFPFHPIIKKQMQNNVHSVIKWFISVNAVVCPLNI